MIEMEKAQNRNESTWRNRFATHGKSNILCHFASNDHFIYCAANVRQKERQNQTPFCQRVRVSRICTIQFNKFSLNVCVSVCEYRIFGVIEMFATGKVR